MEPLKATPVTKLVEEWTTADVCQWLTSIGLEAIVPLFSKEDISGKVLLYVLNLLTEVPSFACAAIFPCIGSNTQRQPVGSLSLQ